MISIHKSFLRQCLISTTRRSYFTDNLGCVIGSNPDRNSDSFKVISVFSFLIPISRATGNNFLVELFKPECAIVMQFYNTKIP